jgi:hypothetical protein
VICSLISLAYRQSGSVKFEACFDVLWWRLKQAWAKQKIAGTSMLLLLFVVGERWGPWAMSGMAPVIST